MIEENMEQDGFLKMLNNFKTSETEFFSLIVTIIDKSKTQNMEDLERLLDSEEIFVEVAKKMFSTVKDIEQKASCIYLFLKFMLPKKEEKTFAKKCLMRLPTKPKNS